MTQVQLAELFQTTKQNISLHVLNILEDGEQDAAATVKEYLTVQTEGSRQVQRRVAHYSLGMILAVGFRVQSERGTVFRKWAATTLGEYLTKGFVLDEWRLKEGKNWGRDYFDELLAKIRDIRASEKRFYQKITDIYATSVDYDAKANTTRSFFATLQNKLHWATHGQTAAETIVGRADADKPNMGLTTWRNGPTGPVRKTDVTVAKNYLNEPEMAAMNRVVTMYLDYAEDQSRTAEPDAHDGLGEEAGRVSGVQRAEHSATRRGGVEGVGRRARGAGVREIRPGEVGARKRGAERFRRVRDRNEETEAGRETGCARATG